MAETPEEKKPDADLIQRGEKDAELQRALKHPVVQHMAQKLETMKSLLEQLPEAIGRAVAAQMGAAAAKQAPDGASAPPVPLRMTEQDPDVEFRPGGQVKLGGSEEAGDPVGIRQLLALVGVPFDLSDIEGWSSRQRQKAINWARAKHLKNSGKKGIRVPTRPAFLK